MAKTPTPTPVVELPDLLELLNKLRAGGATTVPVPVDPITAGFIFGTQLLVLVGKIIDTVPAEQHEANWVRGEKFLETLEKLFNPGGS